MAKLEAMESKSNAAWKVLEENAKETEKLINDTIPELLRGLEDEFQFLLAIPDLNFRAEGLRKPIPALVQTQAPPESAGKRD